jgi:hypothetical protein
MSTRSPRCASAAASAWARTDCPTTSTGPAIVPLGDIGAATSRKT